MITAIATLALALAQPGMASATLPAGPSTAPVQPASPGDRSAENNAIADELTPETDEAIARGLAFLAERQEPDGSFLAGRFGKNVAITSLVCLAFMADGNLPDRGPYAAQVDRGLGFILDSATDSGLIAAGDAQGPMYGHGFAALFLGEIEGMTRGGPDTARADRLHEALVKSIRLIERTQNDEGGWRYNPVPYDADVSVTICQVMALRSARHAGIAVDKNVIDRAVEYVRRCQNPDGGFRYQADSGGSAWPRSAAGVATLFYAGVYSDEAIDSGLAYLDRTAMPGNAMASRSHYFYGHYYAVQANYLAGGEHWERWWPAIRAELLGRQSDDGSWDDSTAGHNYGTAMALIILQMPKRYLPIFQR